MVPPTIKIRTKSHRSALDVAFLTFRGFFGSGRSRSSMSGGASCSGDVITPPSAPSFSGAARGTTGLFGILVSEFLGAESAPVSYENDGDTRRLMVGKKIQGEVVPVKDAKGRETTITNTDYWMGSDVTVGTAKKGRVRAFGRVWDFEGRSAEICQIDWHGPR